MRHFLVSFCNLFCAFAYVIKPAPQSAAPTPETDAPHATPTPTSRAYNDILSENKSSQAFFRSCSQRMQSVSLGLQPSGRGGSDVGGGSRKPRPHHWLYDPQFERPPDHWLQGFGTGQQAPPVGIPHKLPSKSPIPMPPRGGGVKFGVMLCGE